MAKCDLMCAGQMGMLSQGMGKNQFTAVATVDTTCTLMLIWETERKKRTRGTIISICGAVKLHEQQRCASCFSLETTKKRAEHKTTNSIRLVNLRLMRLRLLPACR